MTAKPNNSKDRFTASEVGTLIENFDSRLSIVAEDLKSTKEKVDVIFTEVGRQREDIFILKTDMRIVKSDLREIKGTLKRHEGILKSNDKRLSNLEMAAT